MDDRDDFIEFVKKHFKVKEDRDGSFVVISGNQRYRITNEGLFPPLPGVNKPSDLPGHHGFPHLGDDDICPDFNQRIKKKDRIKGMFPDPKELFPSEETSPIDIDEIYPKSKKKGEGPRPDPDPDHFNPNSFH